MEQYQTVSMNLGELIEILIKAGKLPGNKQVKFSMSSNAISIYESYPKQAIIKFELFEEANNVK